MKSHNLSAVLKHFYIQKVRSAASLHCHTYQYIHLYTTHIRSLSPYLTNYIHPSTSNEPSFFPVIQSINPNFTLFTIQPSSLRQQTHWNNKRKEKKVMYCTYIKTKHTLKIQSSFALQSNTQQSISKKVDSITQESSLQSPDRRNNLRANIIHIERL